MDDRDKRSQLLAGVVIRGKGRPESSRVGLIWGALIVAAGVALLLDHMGFIYIGSLFRFWPMILVFFGIGHVFTPANRAWGVILLVLGAVLQLNNLGITHLRFADMWPIAIIAVGLLLMWGAMKPPIVVNRLKGISETRDTSDVLEAVAIFAGTERRISSQTFKGGRVTSIFGGVELDFRDANIDGDEATLDVNCIFGGVEIRVPDAWVVHSRSIPVLGGYSDKTRLAASAPQDQAAEKRKTLIVTGTVIFGGVEIGN
jgi:predicted membrane protein